MNKDSNKFIVIFASILVVVVALLLTFTHEALRGTQQRNENIDKMSQILRSVKVHAEGVETESIFDKMISDVYLVDNQGNMIPDTKDEAFVADMQVELAKWEDQRRLPVYAAVVD
ncbi:MAG TPA: Na(+)-translocating NADH-quinone reductase subunit C, partial [Dysgonomonas sp.]|nr:Na(+)-translocating NADH-quinone reductase subunit C [Dysgonomonas sp.]